MTYFVTGDTHGHNAERLKYLPPDSALIILGDSGFNFYLNKTDERNKKIVNSMGHIVYCVRGNHEERPENIKDMVAWYDAEIGGPVYRQEKYPNIRYLIDGESYGFGKYVAVAIGGAYSVDKDYRLANFSRPDGWSGWFEDEQLSDYEKARITYRVTGSEYDFVLSHTCPRSFQPVDLFLGGLDESKVDHSMEDWMEAIKDCFTWKVWLFGHYHADRVIGPGVEMFYHGIESLDTIMERQKLWKAGEIKTWTE